MPIWILNLLKRTTFLSTIIPHLIKIPLLDLDHLDIIRMKEKIIRALQELAWIFKFLINMRRDLPPVTLQFKIWNTEFMKTIRKVRWYRPPTLTKAQTTYLHQATSLVIVTRNKTLGTESSQAEPRRESLPPPPASARSAAAWTSRRLILAITKIIIPFRIFIIKLRLKEHNRQRGLKEDQSIRIL